MPNNWQIELYAQFLDITGHNERKHRPKGSLIEIFNRAGYTYVVFGEACNGRIRNYISIEILTINPSILQYRLDEGEKLYRSGSASYYFLGQTVIKLLVVCHLLGDI